MKGIMLLCGLATAAYTLESDPAVILDRLEQNTFVATARYEAHLLISLAGEIREKTFLGYVEGTDRGYVEFTSPPRDRGTRFLKLGKEMWIYLPSLEKATKIAGHMLRQSLMGSDFSYDDMLENERLDESYDATLEGMDTVDQRQCYRLDLVAAVEDVSYQRRIMWIDTEHYIPVRIELYAKTGKLMKEITVTAFKRLSGRNYPTSVRMVNKLRQDTYSEMVIDEITLDDALPARVFTRSYLERK